MLESFGRETGGEGLPLKVLPNQFPLQCGIVISLRRLQTHLLQLGCLYPGLIQVVPLQ